MSKEKQEKSLLDLITAENLQEVNSDKKGLEELTKRFNEVTEFLFATDEVKKVLKEKDQKIADLEAKLEESEEQLKEELEEKNGVRRALRACHHQNDEFADMIKKLVSEKEELKQQLAEKDDEITQRLVIQEKDYEQDKISFAVDKLEKVKDFFLEEHRDEEMDTDYLITKDAGEIAEYLLDQIKQLKEQQK